MSLLLNTGAMHYRENANEEWKPLVIKADVDIESLADPYSPLSTYSVGEYCTHDGKFNRCKTPISTAEAWNSSHWQETTVGQELESINYDLKSLADPYSASSTYSVGEYCMHDGKFNRCKTPISTAEAWNSSHWEETTIGQELESITYVRPNLLDNWYFVGGGSQQGYGVFPINQRGQTTYSGNGRYIDRWIGGTGVVVALDYLTIKAGEWLVQNIASFETLIGKQLTATLLLADNTLLTGTAIITTAGGQLVRLIGTDNIYVYTVNLPSSKGFGIHVYNTDINVVAVKLELGSTQTLAHQEGSTWVLNEVPDYAIEFAKCEAYLLVLDFPFKYAKCVAVGITGTTTDGCRISLQPPVQMRDASASVSMVGGPVNVKCANSQARITGFSWATCSGNTITLAPTLNTAFSSNEAVLYLENETSTAKIIISVE